MFKDTELEIWNLSHEGKARTDACDMFNIVGKLRNPNPVEQFWYRLNQGSRTPIYFNPTKKEQGRLRLPGAFNIDTIDLSDLQSENRLQLGITKKDGSQTTREILFFRDAFEPAPLRFTLDLNGVTAPEQVGQIVDGKWKVGSDEKGRPCLKLAPEDAGYDRIILFGHKDWTTGYEVSARLTITELFGPHNIGFVFKWNPHLRGDGTWLPRQWSTGLGYYCSYGSNSGLRFRFGVDHHVDEQGQKHGDYVLATNPLNTRRRWLNRLKQKLRLAQNYESEFALNKMYRFRMHIHPDRYALTVWPADQSEPSPQVVVEQPKERLASGPVGIIVHQTAMRLYELNVRPV